MLSAMEILISNLLLAPARREQKEHRLAIMAADAAR
jgi:hypothetical protein